jgi:hypothetical protein
VLTVPARSAWMQGQVTWVFLPLLTEAWLAGRRGDAWSAGAWLAPVIALKPSLAPFALVLPWRTSILAAAGSAAATLVSVLILGVGPFQAWLALQSWINWAAAPANASLWALAARLHHWRLADVSLASLPRVEVLLIALVCAGLALPILKTRGDRRWVLAHLWSTLVSPLGWTQYLPWIAGPLLGLRTWPPAFRVVLIGFFVPSSAISAASGDLAPLFGSINAILVFMSFALLAPIPGMTRIDPRETETTAALQGRNRRESPPSH